MYRVTRAKIRDDFDWRHIHIKYYIIIQLPYIYVNTYIYYMYT